MTASCVRAKAKAGIQDVNGAPDSDQVFVLHQPEVLVYDLAFENLDTSNFYDHHGNYSADLLQATV